MCAWVWATFQKNKWVTLDFRVTPLSSIYAPLNSLEQLDSVLKPRSHTDPTHTTHSHCFLSGRFSPPRCRGNHYTITRARECLSTNDHNLGNYPVTSLSPHVESLIHPFLFLSLFFHIYFSYSDYWKFPPLSLHHLINWTNALVRS